MARHPLTAVPATRSSLPLLQIRRRLVVGVLSMAVASGVFSAAAWLTSDHSAAAPTKLPDQSAIALAQTAVSDYLAARDSTVPALSDVNNDFAVDDATGEPRKPLVADSLAFAGATPAKLGDGMDATPVQTIQEKFTATISGRLYAITVLMVSNGKGEWLLGADPAITPQRTAPNQTRDGIDYAQLYGSLNGNSDGSTLPPNYTTEIKVWAQTFAEAGPRSRELYALTGDTSGRTYSGLDGWSLAADPVIKSYVPVATPFRGYIVRVGLVLRAPATNGAAASDGPTLNTDYDLYIRSDKSQQQPPVVAWGAAGSYHSLMPYMNADQS